jgi:hypothetical protein
MIDPLESILFHLLERSVSISAVDLCPWDEQRAEWLLARAGMIQYAPGLWEWTDRTRDWSRQVRAELGVDPRERRRRATA